jgi:class 3 adenylate cyclase
MLARGQAEEAARELARSLGEGPAGAGADLLMRARLLPAQVEVALARDDAATARTAAEQLEGIASEFDRPAFSAAASLARGQIELHEGQAEAAIPVLERALRLWMEIEFPYEAARTRILLGQAQFMVGDPGRARMELGAARSVLERLGASLDLRRLDEIAYQVDKPTEERSRVTRTFMFTDIVTSTDLIGLIGDDAWESLLAWHDRELRTVFAKHGGTEVNHTGDGFFVSFGRSDDAIEAAVTVQRRLADHRREHGFAPSVRIGLHTAEATVDGDDFRGQGVHLGARVGAVAGAEEIVISAAALAAAGQVRYPVSEPRSVELKGITGPVQVHSLDWR